MDDVVLKSNWHIMQISETFEPGIMRVWALTENGQMFNVKLKVPRTIYINSRVVCNDTEFKKVNKLLPRGRKVYHLYEWEKSEDVFLEKFHNINYHHLLNHTVEGVYETKMPLLFKAVMDLGCMVKPNYGVIPRNEQALGRIYKVQELEVKHSSSSNENPYMPSSAFERVCILHSSSGARHFWGLFTEANKDITFYVVNPVGNNKQ